jgi:hypothetical protein
MPDHKAWVENKSPNAKGCVWEISPLRPRRSSVPLFHDSIIPFFHFPSLRGEWYFSFGVPHDRMDTW